MAQYDVHRNPSERTRRAIPLLLTVQHDVVSETSSVLMVPLVQPLKAASKLYPVFEIDGKKYMMLTPDRAAFPRALLGPPVATLLSERSRIVAALDILLVGS
jgi:toxin CcdB